MPVKGGVRRKRNTAPKLEGTGNNTVITYKTPGGTVVTNGAYPAAGWARVYVPGNANGLASSVGPSIVRNYQTAKFLPGTKVRWEPSVSFSTPGRVYAAFVDNPETITIIEQYLLDFQSTPNQTNYNSYVNAVRAVGNCISFPVWQETDIPFYSSMRRKRFDTNATAGVDVNVLDRCCQCALYCAVDGTGLTNQTVGNLQYHDQVDVSGICALST